MRTGKLVEERLLSGSRFFEPVLPKCSTTGELVNRFQPLNSNPTVSSHEVIPVRSPTGGFTQVCNDINRNLNS